MTYLSYVPQKERTFFNKYIFPVYTFPYFTEKWGIEPCFKGKIGTEGIELPVFNLIFLNADVLNQAAAV